MIRARRASREWALKILYSVDIGKQPYSEGEHAAMETLRHEYVQKVSKDRKNSSVESECMECITAIVLLHLGELNCLARKTLLQQLYLVFNSMSYWQEIRFERSLQNREYGLTLSPARLLTPLSNLELFPTKPETIIGNLWTALDPESQVTLRKVILAIADKLPEFVEARFRKVATDSVKTIWDNRPAVGSQSDYLSETRYRFIEDQKSFWEAVRQRITPFLEDWMKITAYTMRLCRTIQKESDAIDLALAEFEKGWSVSRQVSVDRNILRIACCEMLLFADIPDAVAINEAIELAHKYSTADSGKFVNGILGALARKRKPLMQTKSVIEEDAEESLNESEVLEGMLGSLDIDADD